MTCGRLEENFANNELMANSSSARSRCGLHPCRRPPQLHGLARQSGSGVDRPVALRVAKPKDERVRREHVELQVPGHDHALSVIAYGHFGRPVLVFPSEAGRAWDFENNGMIEAVRELVDEGRVKFYCVDSLDQWSWSDRSISIEERALRDTHLHRVADRSGGAVDPPRLSGAEILAMGCSLGAYHAVHFALQRADLVPIAMGFSGNYDVSTWRAWGERGDATYFANPPTTSPISTATTSSGCAAGLDPVDLRPGRLGDPPDRVAALDARAGLSAAGQGDPLRAGPLGARRQPRLAVVAATARLPPTEILLTPRTSEGRDQPRTKEHDGRANSSPRRTPAGHGGGLAPRLRRDHPAHRCLHACGSRSRDRRRARAHLAVQPARPGAPRTGDRPAGALVLPPAGVVEEGRPDGRRLPPELAFTFQSMEKHSAYCALMRLGMKVPETVLVPYKNPIDNVRWAYTSERYNDPFDLAEIAHTWAIRCS